MIKQTKESIEKELQKEQAHLKKLIADFSALGLYQTLGKGFTIENFEKTVVVDTDSQKHEYVTPTTEEIEPSIVDKFRGKAASMLAPVYQKKIDICKSRITMLEQQLAEFEMEDDLPTA